MQLVNIVQGLGVYSSGVCAMVGLFCLGRIPTTVRVLVIHAMLSFYVDVLATLNTTVNNHIVFILYIPFDLLLVSLAARDYLGRTFLPLIVSGLLIAISVFVYVLNKRGGEYIPFEAVVTSFIIQGIIWFIAMLRTSRHSLQRDTIAVYLISGSLLLFVCGSVPMWAMYRYNMVHNPGLSKSLQGLVSIANVLRYSGTAIAFILLANNQTPRQPHAGG